MSVTVTTQAELDAALAASEPFVYISSPKGVWLRVGDTGSATVRAFDSATVHAFGSATVHAFDSATVQASGSATVHASGSVTVQASGSATVHASDSVTVQASGSVTVQASGSATVHAFGSATVRAASYVAVYLHSAQATVEGGVVIDITGLDLKDPSTWCDMQGITVEDGHAIVFKAVDNSLCSGRGQTYPIGKTVAVTAEEWLADGECGRGLHFGPTPWDARTYFDSATRFLACRIPLSHASGIPGGTAKIKARSCEVLYEVDLGGNRVGEHDE